MTNLMERSFAFFIVGMALGSIALFTFFLAVVTVPIYFADKHTCYSAWEDFSPEYGFWTGCRIVVDGKRVPTDKVRELRP